LSKNEEKKKNEKQSSMYCKPMTTLKINEREREREKIFVCTKICFDKFSI